MKASKFVILAGGLLGIVAFFLPLLVVHEGRTTVPVSAFQVVKGLEQISAHIGDQTVSIATASVSDPGLAREGKNVVDGMRGIVLALFAPAVLLALLGAAGVLRKKLGRVGGAFSLIVGLVGLGLGAIVRSAAEGDAGIGVTLMLVAGIAGVIGGLLTLIKPDRGPVPAAA